MNEQLEAQIKFAEDRIDAVSMDNDREKTVEVVNHGIIELNQRKIALVRNIILGDNQIIKIRSGASLMSLFASPEKTLSQPSFAV